MRTRFQRRRPTVRSSVIALADPSADNETILHFPRPIDYLAGLRCRSDRVTPARDHLVLEALIAAASEIDPTLSRPSFVCPVRSVMRLLPTGTPSRDLDPVLKRLTSTEWSLPPLKRRAMLQRTVDAIVDARFDAFCLAAAFIDEHHPGCRVATTDDDFFEQGRGYVPREDLRDLYDRHWTLMEAAAEARFFGDDEENYLSRIAAREELLIETDGIGISEKDAPEWREWMIDKLGIREGVAHVQALIRQAQFLPSRSKEALYIDERRERDLGFIAFFWGSLNDEACAEAERLYREIIETAGLQIDRPAVLPSVDDRLNGIEPSLDGTVSSREVRFRPLSRYVVDKAASEIVFDLATPLREYLDVDRRDRRGRVPYVYLDLRILAGCSSGYTPPVYRTILSRSSVIRHGRRRQIIGALPIVIPTLDLLDLTGHKDQAKGLIGQIRNRIVPAIENDFRASGEHGMTITGEATSEGLRLRTTFPVPPLVRLKTAEIISENGERLRPEDHVWNQADIAPWKTRSSTWLKAAYLLGYDRLPREICMRRLSALTTAWRLAVDEAIRGVEITEAFSGIRGTRLRDRVLADGADIDAIAIEWAMREDTTPSLTLPETLAAADYDGLIRTAERNRIRRVRGQSVIETPEKALVEDDRRDFISRMLETAWEDDQKVQGIAARKERLRLRRATAARIAWRDFRRGSEYPTYLSFRRYGGRPLA